MKRNKISYTAVTMFSECGKKYALHYRENLRPVREKSALHFGKCLDNSFNLLLEKRDLDAALAMFDSNWAKALPLDLQYSKSDFDRDLLIWQGLNPVDGEWRSLCVKGELIIRAFHDKVLPKIKEVIIVQKPVSIKNAEGDEVHGFLDLIVKWEDGKTYLMDNKSSSVPYTPNSAKESNQLVLYYHMEKDSYDLDGIGFIVVSKKINKHKLMTCKNCGKETTGREKTCSALVPKNESNDTNAVKRCHGEFTTSFNPEAEVQFILNTVDEADEDRCIDVFDKANNGIIREEFAPNYNSCFGKFGKCTYYGYCNSGSLEGLVKKEKEVR